MPTGTTLATLRAMLNGETGEEMDEAISPARVAINNQILNNQQSFLFTQHGYLRGKAVVELPVVIGTRYYDVPAGIDFNCLEEPIYTTLATYRYRISNGISQEDYNVFRSDLGVQSSPVMRWQLINISGALKIELWPIPNVAQTIVFTGLLPLTQMAADTDTCVIDDLALVLYTAAEYLARKGAADAGAKAAKAKVLMDALKAAFPIKHEGWNISGQRPRCDQFQYTNNRRPVVAAS
jgi:hypothetical protein